MECGLLGRKLGHSFSPQIHGFLGDYGYDLVEAEPEDVESVLRSGKYRGLNVTIPYKKTVIPFLDELSPVARRLGAVNTIVRREDGTLVGHNTDAYGFASMARRSGIDFAGKKALVLGSGGASVTARAVLEELGANAVIISRNGEDNYDNLDRHADAGVIVNATPVGMYPQVDAQPLSLRDFPKLEGVLDVIYNPARTNLLMEAEGLGIPGWNGLWMLVAQAKESAEWFTGSAIPEEKIQEIYDILRLQTENLVLVGMPGSGKTTIGRLLAEATGKTFVDADTELEKMAGSPITQIIPREGEQAFRDLEIRVLAELGKRSGTVIATGGGCVTREENYKSLHRCGRIVWLKRDVDSLPTQGRPLSRKGSLREMLEKREPLYRRFADFSVDNNGTPEEPLREILSKWEEKQ